MGLENVDGQHEKSDKIRSTFSKRFEWKKSVGVREWEGGNSRANFERCDIRGLSRKYPTILNISRTGRVALM